ncbi:hypothetical protein [Microcoleus sp. Pol10D4]|uniref:hypothetical protein n=1 Tax=Microcoleus sp. Pol10D4 TaxID=3055387 RepID=UPI002FD481C1
MSYPLVVANTVFNAGWRSAAVTDSLATTVHAEAWAQTPFPPIASPTIQSAESLFC